MLSLKHHSCYRPARWSIPARAGPSSRFGAWPGRECSAALKLPLSRTGRHQSSRSSRCTPISDHPIPYRPRHRQDHLPLHRPRRARRHCDAHQGIAEPTAAQLRQSTRCLVGVVAGGTKLECSGAANPSRIQDTTDAMGQRRPTRSEGIARPSRSAAALILLDWSLSASINQFLGWGSIPSNGSSM